jgi:hypothetical protein
MLLDEHKVLTTRQIAAIEFSSFRRAQDRLRQLREMQVVFAFRDSYSTGGTSQTRFALGYQGARLIAAQRSATPTPKAYTESLERLGLAQVCAPARRQRVFWHLAAHSRSHRDSALTQWWWSENRCTAFFWNGTTKLRPDGYSCWEERGRTVRFFLEFDTGSEPLPKVARKLDDYAAFATDSFGVLLFSVHSGRREIHLRDALAKALGRSTPGIVIATSSRDLDHSDGPAGPLWSPLNLGVDQRTSGRLRLSELPCRGPAVEHHAPVGGLPFTESAYLLRAMVLCGCGRRMYGCRRRNDSYYLCKPDRNKQDADRPHALPPRGQPFWTLSCGSSEIESSGPTAARFSPLISDPATTMQLDKSKPDMIA